VHDLSASVLFGYVIRSERIGHEVVAP